MTTVLENPILSEELPAVQCIAEQVAQQREMCVGVAGASWELYEELLDISEGMNPRPRLAFWDQHLEIMSPPSFDHEHSKCSLGRLIQTFAEERGIELDAAGSTTQKIVRCRGKEPDESFFVNREGGPGEVPDLVVEVKVTRGGVDTLAFWHPFGVPEVWIFEGGRLRLFQLQPEAYQEAGESSMLPGIPVRDLEELVGVSPTTKAVREFRKRLQTGERNG